MKILFFKSTLGAGGTERRLTELMKWLKLKSDFEFEIILMSTDIHYKEIYDLGINIHFILRKTKKDIFVFGKLYKLCKELQPDILHCWDSMTAVYSAPICKLLGIKLINGLITNSLQSNKLFNKHWLRAKLTFPLSDLIIGNSKAGLKTYNAHPNKSICIYNGVDFSRIKNVKNPLMVRGEIFKDMQDDFFVAGMVAAFEKRKDYKTLIEIAIEIVNERKDIKFILVGDGADFYRIKSIVPASLSTEIIFLGKRTDVESIVNIFDIGILLTNAEVHGEGISNSILEYMALGKPVIATMGGGTNEVVIDNENGFLIEPGNKIQLKNRIYELIGNKELTKKFGNRGQQIVREKFDIEIQTQQYISLYKNLIESLY